MMNKKGFMKIVEASLAIFIVLAVLFFVSNKQISKTEIDLSQKARDILEEISKNTTIREAILTENTGLVNSAIGESMPESYLEFEAVICETNEVCGKSTYTKGNVYSGERLVSSIVKENNFSPKRVRLFIWDKGS